MTLHNHVLFIAFAFLHFLSTLFPLVSTSSPVVANSSYIHKDNPWEDSHKFTTYEAGQNYKGLSKVKNYLHKLGYISHVSPSNLDDNFDDNLVSAIQTYQKFYNLNTTGKLDQNTVRQLMMPRCGFPDMINSNTTKTLFGRNNTHSLHTVSHYSYFQGYPRWPRGTTTLIYAYPPWLTLNDAAKNLFQRSFDRWSQVVNLIFRLGSYQSTNIVIDFLRGNHGDGEPFDGPLGTWAHAFAPTDGRCHFDADEDWVAYGDVRQSPNPNAVDLESVAIHEIGHLLGLFHSQDPTAIMYAYINPKTVKVNLTPDDIQGIQNLYP